MVDGIVDILKQVTDMNNRRNIADNMVEQFQREGIIFMYDNFYKKCGLVPAENTGL